MSRSSQYRWGVKYKGEDFIFAAFTSRADAEALVAFDNTPDFLEVVEL